MDKPRTIPPIVQALAQQVGMTPFDWWEHPDHITITFIEGPKMTFERKKTSKTTITKLTPVPAPARENAAPAETQTPHGSQPKSKKGKPDGQSS